MTFDEFYEKEQNKEKLIQEQKNNKKNNKKKGRKRFAIRFAAFALAGVTGLTGLVHLFGKNKNNNDKVNEVRPTQNPVVSELPENTELITSEAVSLADLGVSIENNTKDEPKKEYGKTTGDVDVTKIVKDSNGTTWANEEAKKKSKDVGTTTTDTKNGKYTTDKNGKVKDKKTGYEVKDKNGKVKDTGDLDEKTGVPKGYVWDKDRHEYVKKEDLGKYVYDKNGNLVPKSKVTKTPTPTKAPAPTKTPTPTKTPAPTKTPTPTKTPAPTKTPGQNNNDGTYTDQYGNVWGSYEDYQRGIQNPDGIEEINGYLYCDKAKTLQK